MEYVLRVWNTGRLFETPVENPVDAMEHLSHDTAVDGYFCWQWAECWMVLDGKLHTRQWRMDVD